MTSETEQPALETTRRARLWARLSSKPMIGLLGVVGVFVGGWGVYWITSKEPHLTYSVIEAFPIEDNNENTGIYHVSVFSDGSKEVDKVVCSLQVPGATIKKNRVKTTPSTLVPTKKSINKDGDTLLVEFESVNQGQKISMSVEAVSSIPLPATAKFKFRAFRIGRIRIYN